MARNAISAVLFFAFTASAQFGPQSDLTELRKGADQGDVTAQFNLGYRYFEGQGLPQDYAEAALWFRKGAGQGDAFCQYNLAQMLRDGQGVPRNYPEALKWFRNAADQGKRTAKYRVAGSAEV